MKRYFLKLFALDQLPADERRVRLFLGFCVIVITLVLSGFALHHYFLGNMAEWLLDSVAAAALALVLYPLMRGTEFRKVFRTALLVSVVLIWIGVVLGLAAGYAWIWYCLVPPLACLVLESREGSVWSLISPLPSLPWLVGWMEPGLYDPEVTFRFLVALGLLWLLSVQLETTRRHLLAQVRAERDQLARLLDEKHELTHLLPICAACKKIRDDRGYWNELEAYLEARTDAQFASGICPGCAAESDQGERAR